MKKISRKKEILWHEVLLCVLVDRKDEKLDFQQTLQKKSFTKNEKKIRRKKQTLFVVCQTLAHGKESRCSDWLRPCSRGSPSWTIGSCRIQLPNLLPISLLIISLFSFTFPWPNLLPLSFLIQHLSLSLSSISANEQEDPALGRT